MGGACRTQVTVRTEFYCENQKARDYCINGSVILILLLIEIVLDDVYSIRLREDRGFPSRAT
jgi:hypothetical protein